MPTAREREKSFTFSVFEHLFGSYRAIGVPYCGLHNLHIFIECIPINAVVFNLNFFSVPNIRTVLDNILSSLLYFHIDVRRFVAWRTRNVPGLFYYRFSLCTKHSGNLNEIL